MMGETKMKNETKRGSKFGKTLACTGAFAVAAAMLVASGASAADLAVSATVNNTCTVSTTNTLPFGTYNPLLGTALDTDGAVNVACTNGSAAQVGLGNGLYFSATGTTASQRKMYNGQATPTSTDYVNYEIYRETGRTSRWGSTLGTDSVGHTGTGATVAVPVYGRILASQTTTEVGSYSDTVAITTSF